MAKNKISEYSATAASNTDVANINIAEGCSPSNVNNAIRGVMAHLKDFQAGNVTGNALAIAGGGTGAETASAARTNLGAAASGSNSDITSLSGLTSALSTSQGGTALTSFTSGGAMYATSTSALTTGTLPVASGGTGATSLTANNVLLGNGTSAPQTVAPGTSGNVLTSNGTTWQSSAPSVTSSSSFVSKAWVSFTGAAAIQSSFNVSSVTRQSAGKYTITFTSPFANSNYAVLCTPETTDDLDIRVFGYVSKNGKGTSTLKVTCHNIGAYFDPTSFSVVVFA